MLRRPENNKRIHVLVIEPNDANRRLLSWTLRSEGFRVTEAADATTLDELIAGARPDIDLVVAEARQYGLRRVHCPLVLMSSDLSTSARHRARRLGANASIHRPIYVDELKQAVAAAQATSADATSAHTTSARRTTKPYPPTLRPRSAA